MKPPISYYGGKHNLSQKLLPHLPDYKIYVEPFAGSASLLFARDPSEKYAEVINDHDLRLHNFYSVLQNPDTAAGLISKLMFTPYSRYIHDKAVATNRSGAAENDVERAYYYFVDLMSSYNNVLGGGWSRMQFSKRVRTFHNKVRNLETFVERLENVYIEHLDALECIDRWDTEDTFFYIDPPYVGCDQGHYRGFKQPDFNKLIDKLKGIKGKFFLSHYDNSVVPSHWHKFEFPANCRSANQRCRSEIVWANFEVEYGSCAKTG